MAKSKGKPNSTPDIHTTALVDPKADLGPGVEVGPFAIIGPDVRIGPRTVVKAYTTIEGSTVIGEENIIGPYATLGAPPQDLKFRGERTTLKIGNRNVIREQATLHVGTAGGRSETTVGDDCLLMVGVHIAHDCDIGNKVIIANATHLGGHITIEDNAVLGALIGIHQHVRIGAVAMVAATAAVPMDVPPYTLAAGDRAKLFGLNAVGMKRVGIPRQTRALLRKAYRIVFQSSLKLAEAVEKVRNEVESCEEIEHFLKFIESSDRGILR